MKLNVASVSGTIINSAVFRPELPSVCKFSSSSFSKLRTAGMLSGASRVAQEIKILLAVLPAAHLYALYCFTATLSLSSLSSSSNK